MSYIPELAPFVAYLPRLELFTIQIAPQTFRPKEENPPELNEFLNSVMEHKEDFGAVRQAARKYQKMKKDIQDVDLSFMDPVNVRLIYI